METLIRRETINWYRSNGRDFPWRHTEDPYKIMIAEFMLHRTRAEQVVPVYLRFIKNYPDINSLINADEKEISKVTQHLGLHWRAEHFIKSVRVIMKKYGGKFPEKREELLTIPGIGEYMAGAILAVCFNKSAPVVDSNIARFIDRFYGFNLRGELRRKKRVVEKADNLFRCDEPGELLFAFVDFTSMICKPLNPQCDICSLKNYCKYFQASDGN